MYLSIEEFLSNEFLSLNELTQNKIIKDCYPIECEEINNFFNKIQSIVKTWGSAFYKDEQLNETNILLFSLFNQINYNFIYGYYDLGNTNLKENSIIIASASSKNRFTDKLTNICNYTNLNPNYYYLIDYPRIKNIKSYTELKNKFKEENAIIYLSRGSFYVLDKNIIVLNTDFLMQDNQDLKNLILSIVINKLILSQQLTKEQLIAIKQYLQNYQSLEDLRLSTNSLTDLLHSMLEFVFNLTKKQEALVNKNKELHNKKVQTLLEQTLRNNVDMELNNIENNITQLEYRYSELLEQRFNYQCKKLGVKELVNNCYDKLTRYLNNQVGNTLQNYKLDCQSDLLVIQLDTKWLPIVFLDKEMLNATIRNNIFKAEINEQLEKVKNGECQLWTTPHTVVIKIRLLQNRLYGFESYNKTHLPDINNGHITYHCLGTFNLEIEKAIKEMNLAKTVALFIQYLQSITPTDVAGQKAIRNCCIVDNDKNIVYSAYDNENPDNDSCFTDKNINDFDYEKGEWKCQQ